MKTQIITLETHDDLISVRDRMSWAKTPRILLVWPKYEKIALRQVDLKVLQRHAASLGAQLGLVTRRRRVRAEADTLGIPVFESTGQAQRAVWTRPERRRLPHKTPDRTLREKRNQLPALKDAGSYPVVRIPAFLVGVLSVLVLVALFIPRARVTLKPVMQTQSITLPVTASPLTKSVYISGSIPALEKRIVLEGKQTLAVTGEGIVPQSKAKGVVVFRNLTQNAITVPAGTVVLGNNIRFITTKEGVLDAGITKTLELPIEAVEGGLAGNLDAETINTIEGRLALSLSVTNPEPIDGGRERASLQASDADRARAKDLLLKKLASDARSSMADELNPEDVLFDKTLTVSRILSEVYDPPAGAAGPQLTLTMQVEFSVLHATASDLTKLASLALNASLPSGFSAPSDDVTVKPVTSPRLLDDGSLRWTIRAEREIVQQLNPVQVTQLVQGLSSSAAQSRLEENLPSMSRPRLSMNPSWWPWVPIVPFRIEVVTQ